MSLSSPRTESRGSGFHLGPWRVEPTRNALFKGSEECRLENRLMQTLVFLAENQGRVVTREDFFNSVWQGRVVNEEALSRAISLLRRALGDNAHAPDFIQTIPGVGYRLIAEVHASATPGAKESPDHLVQANSIAVLPFVNLSEDPANEFFSDGVSEEILNVLSQIRRFKVAGRTSSFSFKGRNEDLRKIGKILSVSHVLEGSVRKVGSSVRITAQLINTEDGYHLWSKTFARELDDIFAVQDEIALAISHALKVELLGEADGNQTGVETSSIEAYQAYLKGMHYRHRGALRDTLQRAADAFQKAIELDPGYAKAHAGMAFTWNDLVWNGIVSQENGLKQMYLSAAKAVELAPDLADGHLALGLSLQTDLQSNIAAQKAINKALELNPGNTTVLIEYSRINCNLGNHDTSIATARKALELDPISVYANHWLGHTLYFARRYEEAIKSFRQTLELNPHYPKPHYFIAMSYLWMGDPETALIEIQHEPLTWMRLTASSQILWQLGQFEEAATKFEALIQLGLEDDVSCQQAGIFALQGEIDLAMERLCRAFELGDQGLTQLKINQYFDPLRGDKRFVEMMAKLGFSDK